MLAPKNVILSFFSELMNPPDLARKVKKYAGKLLLVFLFKIRHPLRAGHSDAFAGKKTVLFFLPEMAVGLYENTLVSIATEIRDHGYEPLFFGCNGFLNNCMLKDQLLSRSALLKWTSTCAVCRFKAADAERKYGINYLEQKHSGSLPFSFAGNTVDERLAYSYKGISVGRLAYYDLSIKFKRDRSRRELNQQEILYYDRAIADGVSIIDLLDRNKRSVPLEAVVAIDEYSLANVIREWARINLKLAYRAGLSYHFNADPQFITLSSSKTRAREKYNRSRRWELWRDIPLPAPVIDEISADLIFRMTGTGGHIFSSNYTGDLGALHKKYGLRQDVKTLVVFTSANDEIEAISELSIALDDQFVTHDAFESQIDWLEAIVAYARQSDVQVIIKLHPRILQSHRDSGSAEDIHIYQELADASPGNVVFLWPEQNVSAYDILQIADVCLTSWGTMGLEAAKLGVPVLTGMTKITFATPGLSLFSKADSAKQFERLLDESKTQITINDLSEAYRWHHLLHLAGAIVIEGARNLNLYGQDFACNFSDVLTGADVEKQKLDFLSHRAAKDLSFAQQEESAAILRATQKLTDFFGHHANKGSFDSKLLTRLTSIKSSAIHED